MFTHFPPHETSPVTVSKCVIIQTFISFALLVIWTYLMPIKICRDCKIIHPFQFLIRLLPVTSKSFSSTSLYNVLKGRMSIKSPSYNRKKRRVGPKSSKLSINFLCPIRDINTSCILQFFIYSNYSSTQLEMQLSAEQEASSLPAVPNFVHSSFPTFCSSMRQITKRRGLLWAQQKSTNQIWISQIPFCTLSEVRHFSDRPTVSIKNLNNTNDCNQSYTLKTT